MALTQSEIWGRINRKIHNAKAKLGGDTELQNITNEALRECRLEVDFISTKRESAPFLVFQDVYEYSCPSDIDYDKSIHFVEMQKNRTPDGEYEKVTPSYFFNLRNPFVSGDRFSSSGVTSMGLFYNRRNTLTDQKAFAIEFQEASPFLMLKTSGVMNASEVNGLTTPTNNGTWVGTNAANNLRTDNQRYIDGGSSIAFDCDGSVFTLTLTNSTMTPVNLSAQEGKGVEYLYIDTPHTGINNIELRWGSSPTDYWTTTATTAANGLGFKIGWNLVRFPWEEATTVGVPDSTNITYVQININQNTLTPHIGFHVNALWSRFGRELTMKYYSKLLVRNALGVLQENFTAASDTIVLQAEEVDIFIEKCAMKASQQLREMNDYQIASQNYALLKANYMSKFPSQQAISSYTYYNM